MGVRHGFGLWLTPISTANGWDREVFSFALALQNLSWGVFGIFAGMLADRFGAYRVIIGGAIAYCLGLLGMAFSETPLSFALTTGVLLGLAQAGTTYSIIYGVLGFLEMLVETGSLDTLFAISKSAIGIGITLV